MTGLQSWGIDFFLFLFSEIEEKTNASTLKTCHFKASRDITTNFGSGTLDNNINKWPKVGRHNWPPCMISDNFKIAILLYVYYMGAIETWPTLYVVLLHFYTLRLKLKCSWVTKVWNQGVKLENLPQGKVHKWCLTLELKVILQSRLCDKVSD